MSWESTSCCATFAQLFLLWSLAKYFSDNQFKGFISCMKTFLKIYNLYSCYCRCLAWLWWLSVAPESVLVQAQWHPHFFGSSGWFVLCWLQDLCPVRSNDWHLRERRKYDSWQLLCYREFKSLLTFVYNSCNSCLMFLKYTCFDATS